MIALTCNICEDVTAPDACATCDTVQCTAIICSQCMHNLMRCKEETYQFDLPCPFCNVGIMSIDGVEEATMLENQLILNGARYLNIKDPKSDNDYRRMIDKFKAIGYEGTMSQLSKHSSEQPSTSQLRLEVARLCALFEDKKSLPPGPLEKIIFSRKRKHSSDDVATDTAGLPILRSSLIDSNSSPSFGGSRRVDINMDGLLQRFDGISKQVQSQSRLMNEAAVVQRELVAKVSALESQFQAHLTSIKPEADLAQKISPSLSLGSEPIQHIKADGNDDESLRQSDCMDKMMVLVNQTHQQLMDLNMRIASSQMNVIPSSNTNMDSIRFGFDRTDTSPTSSGFCHSMGREQQQTSTTWQRNDLECLRREMVAELKKELMVDFKEALNSAVQQMYSFCAPPTLTCTHTKVETASSYHDESVLQCHSTVSEASDHPAESDLHGPPALPERPPEVTESEVTLSALSASEVDDISESVHSSDPVSPVHARTAPTSLVVANDDSLYSSQCRANDLALASGAEYDELCYKLLLGSASRADAVRLRTRALTGDPMAACFAAALFFHGHRYVVKNEGKSVEFALRCIPAIQDLSKKFHNKYAQYHLGLFLLHGIGIDRNESDAMRLLTLSAHQGYSLAQFTLGLCYHEGIGVERNSSLAFDYFLQSAQQQRADGQFFVGYLRELDGRVEEAVLFYRLAVQQGYAPAHYRLGYCYDMGLGVEQDERAAFEHCSLSAAQEYSVAQYTLGIFYRNGRGVAKSEAQAMRCCKLAADNGHSEAQYAMGCRYMDGEGVVRSEAMAAHYYKLAADQGHLAAQYIMGGYYLNGLGVVKCEAMAAHYYKLAADQGNSKAQHFIATFYRDGRGVVADRVEAARYFRLAAEQGSIMSQFSLGTCFALGTGVQKNDSEAVHYYRLAADHPQGYAHAQYAMGMCLGKGKGVEKDEVEAIRYYQLAADQGLHKAQYSLGYCYERGKGIARSEAEAVRYYKLAADQGYAPAMVSLALCFAHGRGVTTDLSQAMMYYDQANAKGSKIRIDVLERERAAKDTSVQGEQSH